MGALGYGGGASSVKVGSRRAPQRRTFCKTTNMSEGPGIPVCLVVHEGFLMSFLSNALLPAMPLINLGHVGLCNRSVPDASTI